MILAALCLSLCPLPSQPMLGTGNELAARPSVEDQAALLVPDGAILVVRFESATAFLDLAQAFARLAEGDVPEDVADLLETMELPGNAAQIDPSRPVLLAFSLGVGTPLPTVVLPTLDAQAYVASLGAEPNITTTVSGSYVGFSGTPNYALRSAPHPLVAGMRPGLVSAHLDLGTLIQTYRPMIEMGLEQVETMMDEMSDVPDSPMDMGALLEVYMDGIWAFVDSAQGLDMAVDYDGRSLSLRGDLATKDKSPMAGFGGEGSYDLHAAARYLDPKSGLCMLAACDWARSMAQFKPIMDAVFSAYPEPLGADLKRYMTAYTEMLSILGPLAVASGDLAPGGIRMSYSLPSDDPANLAASMAAALGKLSSGQADSAFTLSPSQPITVGKVQALRTHLDFDMAALMAGLAGDNAIESQQLEMMQTLMAGIYGANGMDITMAPLADRMLMVLGGDAAYTERSFAAAPTKFEDLPADLQRAIDAASGGSTAIVYRFDYGQLMGQMGALFAEMGMGELDMLGELDVRFPVTFWMAIRGSTWSGGTSLDMAGLGNMIASLRDATEDAEDAEEIEDMDEDDMDEIEEDDEL